MSRDPAPAGRSPRRHVVAGTLAAAALASMALVACGGEAVSARAPVATPTECGTYSGSGCAPTARRVDRTVPAFSNPSKITNPLFPIGALRSAVLLGTVDGEAFRSETTLLPGTRTIRWNGEEIQTLASQYTAYLDGRIEEVALDRYAQADDGSVWYFGEDVVDYRDGSIVTTEGTWLAGIEGPPAMIMPADPKVGDVFRPENILGIVFEEVTVTKVGQTVQSARGPIQGAIVGTELHLDESTSDKVFAPGYGEFFSGKGSATEALAVAVPADSLTTPMPAQLDQLATAASGMLGSVRGEDWEAAEATLRRMTRDWRAVKATPQPPRVAGLVERALGTMTRAVAAKQPGRASQAAIDLGISVQDLRLRHRPADEVDRARFDLWCQQVLVHTAAGDAAGVRGSVATLEWIRDRITTTLSPAALAEVDARLRAMRVAADAGSLAATADHAIRLGQRLRSLS